MKKTSLSSLIANDIIHFGMDMTSNFNYIVSLDDYQKEFDDETKEYINNHEEDIIEEIKQNENVADMQYSKNDRSIDMVFYFDGLIDHVEKMIYSASEKMDISLDVEQIRTISADIYDDEDFADKVVMKVAKFGEKNYEI